MSDLSCALNEALTARMTSDCFARPSGVSVRPFSERVFSILATRAAFTSGSAHEALRAARDRAA